MPMMLAPAPDMMLMPACNQNHIACQAYLCLCSNKQLICLIVLLLPDSRSKGKDGVTKSPRHLSDVCLQQETKDKHEGQKDGQDFMCCDPITVMLGLAPQAVLASSSQICTVDQGKVPGKCSMRAVGSVKEANVELVQKLDHNVLMMQLEAVTSAHL